MAGLRAALLTWLRIRAEIEILRQLHSVYFEVSLGIFCLVLSSYQPHIFLALQPETHGHGGKGLPHRYLSLTPTRTYSFLIESIRRSALDFTTPPRANEYFLIVRRTLILVNVDLSIIGSESPSLPKHNKYVSLHQEDCDK
jgi:hypothetical protein